MRNSCGIDGKAGRGETGVMLVEITITTVLLLTGIVASASVILALSRQRVAVEARERVLTKISDLSEAMRGMDPGYLTMAYDETYHPVEGVEGRHEGGATVHVRLDSTVPKLPVVTVDAAWVDCSGREEGLQVRFRVYSQQGQCGGSLGP